jgi:exonuclease VII small subunit
LPALVLLSACHRNMVRLRVAPDSAEHVWRRPLSPGQLGTACRELLFTVEPPLGYARGRTRRLEGFQFNIRVRWNVTVDPVCGAVTELYERHNAGDITVLEFEQRREALSRAVSQLADRQGRLQAALADYREARDALLEADTETSPPEMWERLQSAQKRAEDILNSAAQLAASVLDEGDEQTSSQTGERTDA